MYRAAVLGCGPAGIFAAQALGLAGWDVRIFSKKRRSEMFGAQYLHAPIPLLTDEARDFTLLEYVLQGTIDGYRQKVYGGMDVPVSPERFLGSHRAWDIRGAYYRGWDLWRPKIEDTPDIDGSWIAENARDFRMIVSSIPAPDLCLSRHTFGGQNVWAIGDAPERGIFCPITHTPNNTVWCNGEKDVGWYRASNVFGYRTAEWPEDRKPPIKEVASILKPISTNCDCHEKRRNFLRVGRFGRWSKDELSHQAFARVAGAALK